MDQNILIIDAVRLSQYVEVPLAEGGLSPLQRVAQYAQGLLESGDTEQVFWLTDSPRLQAGALPGEVVFRETWSLGQFLDTVTEKTLNQEAILFVSGDTPFLDEDLTRQVTERFGRYYADYCFCDGYPLGLAPEMIRASLVPQLAAFQRETPIAWERGFLFSLIQRDINAFDIETLLAPRDYRMLRLTLAAETKGTHLLLQRLCGAGLEDVEQLLDYLDKNPLILRTLPAYYQIQCTDGCPQSCSYCPYPQMNPGHREGPNYLSSEDWSSLVEEMAALSGEAVVSLSPWGEPSLHPDFPGLAETLLGQPGLSLVVETSGLGWKEDTLKQLADLAQKAEGQPGRRKNYPALVWIVSLDALSEEVYRELRGEGWSEVQETLALLDQLFPGQVYRQALRTKETVAHLEELYRTWKENYGNMIIQKYDHFCGVLPQRRVTDLSPLKRNPCWHLQRDMVILWDGRVPLCREDINEQMLLGNWKTEGLKELWHRGEGVYQAHLQGDYPELCGKCDEYYSYNF